MQFRTYQIEIHLSEHEVATLEREVAAMNEHLRQQGKGAVPNWTVKDELCTAVHMALHARRLQLAELDALEAKLADVISNELMGGSSGNL